MLPKIIDNGRKQLGNTLKELAKSHDHLSIATGYWDLPGTQIILDGKAEISRQEKRLTRLLMERQRILQAFYDDDVSSSMLGNEQKRIDTEVAELKEVVDEATKARASAQRSYRAALELATTLDLEKSYLNAHPLLRRCLNQALFSKIRIDDTNAVTVIGKFGPRKDHDVRVLSAELHPQIDHQRLAQAVIGLTMDRADLE